MRIVVFNAFLAKPEMQINAGLLVALELPTNGLAVKGIGKRVLEALEITDDDLGEFTSFGPAGSAQITQDYESEPGCEGDQTVVQMSECYFEFSDIRGKDYVRQRIEDFRNQVPRGAPQLPWIGKF